MNAKLLFPVAIIALQFGASVVYALSRDWRHAIYWISAVALNLAVSSF